MVKKVLTKTRSSCLVVIVIKATISPLLFIVVVKFVSVMVMAFHYRLIVTYYEW